MIRDFFNRIFSSRLRVMTCVMILFSCVLIIRLFILQIVNGSQYQANYDLKVEKTESIDAARGCIYDRNGEVLAYNKLAYAITIEDSGSYESSDDRNEKLNSEIATIINHIEKNGDKIDNDFGIIRSSTGKYEFVQGEGTALQRFRADVFGYASIEDLKYNSKLKIDEKSASADEIMSYLMGEHRYDISRDYSEEMRYKICIVRYNIGQNSFQKYIATTIASDVSDASVAYIKENMNKLTGVNIEEKSIRYYVDSEYFAHIIGYTGTISTEEYKEKSKKDKTVELTDVVGKSGIEQYMNEYLSGEKGEQTIYVDNMGNLIQVSDQKDSIPGNHVYLSIDKNLQIATYKALEKEIAGILYSKIANIKTYDATSDEADIVIPIYDVYFAFINNNLIKIDDFEKESASATEKKVLHAYNKKADSVIATLKGQLHASSPTAYKDLPKEYQEYSTYLVTTLKSQGIFDADAIDNSDEMYQKWTNEELSVNEYLMYAIEQNWIDITKYSNTSKYADTEELYDQLISYGLTNLQSDRTFQKKVYKYLIQEDSVSGNELCAILFEQGVLKDEDGTKEALLSGGISAYSFVLDSIKNSKITPAQLALDPCSGSAVVIDSKSGELLACVTYPGYDNNRLANAVDAEYYNYLSTSLSNPLYNYATQQKTAPGSTYKIISATAGLAENTITTSTQIDDLGQFELVSNKPKCWAYPSNHGLINVSQALRVSCNYFFYQVGYDLAGGSNYQDESGIQKLQKYAAMYGLDAKTGIEIEEAKPSIATEYPVMAAIGQSNNNFTTISLARYATAVSNRGTVYDLTLLDHVQNAVTGDVMESYKPKVRNQVSVLTGEEWSSISSGLRGVVEDLTAFDGLSVPAAGKTGTAQQDKTRPNHALFIGYAPYNSPEIAVATRIAFGYSSGNASKVAADIMSYYFGETSLESLMGSEITTSTSTNAVTD
ncbi:MAG: penicillin-binding transpeptidase domain-containing protein [Lachnospiraceae bacterium]|nr:penicillin-binding transpeptidase domain-containing protein [Lachnospiraceae bacterium]